jgi:hypothetical protein
MIKRILPPLLFILSLFFIFPGCSVNKPLLSDRVLKNNFPSPHDVLEKLDRDDHFKKTLNAIAHIELHASEKRYPLKAAVMLKQPSSFRVESIPVFGPPDLLLSVHADILKVFLPHKGEFYIGQATTKNLIHFLPFFTTGLRVEDITSILLGTHPKIKEKSFTLNGSFEGDIYRIDIVSENRRLQSLWIDTEKYYLVRVDLFGANNSRLYSAKFTGHYSVGNVTMPQRVIIASGGDDKQNIIIRYSDVQTATGIDTAQFDLQPPPGIRTIFMD